MKLKLAVCFVLLVAAGAWAFLHFHSPSQSPYAGQQNRDIKSLSNADIEELRRGGGWGLAKAAELNGVPGPKHLLEMKDEIALSQTQIDEITQVFEAMRTSAKSLGTQLIERERQLEEQFRNSTIDEESLETLLKDIAAVRAQLRFAHLSAHLKTPEIVSSDQIEHYNSLRGYGSDDPCANIPKGHNPDMWRKHNGCS